MSNLLLVGTGAALGAVVRYDTTKWVKHWRASTFPIATLLINWVGALLLGMVASRFQSTVSWYYILGTGFCGGFTTFSTLSVETVTLLKQRYIRLAIYYVALTYIGGIGAMVLGYIL